MTPVKRPRDPQRSARIVAATRDIIREHGVAAVTHRVVAQRAAVPLGSTTYYFATIEDILAAAIGEEITSFRMQAERSLAASEGASAADRVISILRGGQLRHADREVGLELYLAALSRPQLRPLAIEWINSFVSILESFLSPRQAEAVASLLDGVLIRSVLIPAEQTDGTLDLRAVLSAIISGLTPVH